MGQVFKGYYNAGVSIVEGVIQMVVHPVQTAQGVATAAAHPVRTAQAIAEILKEKSQTLEGQGEIAGDILIGFAGGAALKAATKSATIGKLASGLRKITGGVADDAADVGKNLNAASKSASANNVNAGVALRKKLSALQKAQKKAASTRHLPDGRIRYYEAERLARNPGPTRGASFVTEWDPVSGKVRQWMESYDRAGNVIRVHPKTLNGQDLISPHFPPTGLELFQ